MKKIINTFSIFLVSYVVYFLINNPEELDVLSNLSLSLISTILFIKFVTLIVNSLFNKELLKGFDLEITNFESLYLSSLTFIGNLYLPFRSGGNFRMIYLNRKYKFKSPELVSIYGYFFIVTIFLNSAIGLVALYLLNPIRSFNFYLSVSGFLIIFVFSYFMLFNKFKTYNSAKLNNLFQWLKNLKKSWMKITDNTSLQVKLISYTFLNYLFFALEALIIFNYLFDKTELFSIFYYNSISVLSSLASLTPASLGIKDGIVFFSSNILNLTVTNIITLMIVERAVSILFSIIPGIVLLVNQKISS
tara:strand:+ start:117 stop:1028 length:912 start_codon:yes stop_codon:yes gene_type:complete